MNVALLASHVSDYKWLMAITRKRYYCVPKNIEMQLILVSSGVEAGALLTHSLVGRGSIGFIEHQKWSGENVFWGNFSIYCLIRYFHLYSCIPILVFLYPCILMLLCSSPIGPIAFCALHFIPLVSLLLLQNWSLAKCEVFAYQILMLFLCVALMRSKLQIGNKMKWELIFASIYIYFSFISIFHHP